MILKFVIITISDRSYRQERDDASGPLLMELVRKQGWSVSVYEIIPDQKKIIKDKLKTFAQSDVDIIITTGGTGFSPKDITPEATKEVLEKEIPGFGELMRIGNYKKTEYAVLSRGISGIINRSIVINLPGSPKGAVESLEILLPILPHSVRALKNIINDCKEDHD